MGTFDIFKSIKDTNSSQRVEVDEDTVPVLTSHEPEPDSCVVKVDNKGRLCAPTVLNGRYRIEKILGQGGGGITYLAYDIKNNRKVALKEFFIKGSCGRDMTSGMMDSGEGDEHEWILKLKDKFIKEANNLAKFHHPYVINSLETFRQNGTVYYTMEYIQGRSLAEIVKESGPLNVEKALKYINKVAIALNYVHFLKFNHLDVKPANIMVRDSDDTPILIDFGISKHYDESGRQTTCGVAGLSRGYSPIELTVEGKDVAQFSPATEVYSLGATLFYLLTGIRPPEPSKDNLLVFPSSIPDVLQTSIKKAMSYTRSERYASMFEFIEAIEKDLKSESNAEYKNIECRNIALFPFRPVEDALYGYIDKDGQMAIPPKFEEAYDFKNGLANVKIRGKYGFIDKTGTFVISPEFDDLDDFEEGLAIGYKDENSYIIHLNGEIITIKEQYDYIYDDFHEGLLNIELNERFGYLNSKGKYAILPQYRMGSKFSNGLACVAAMSSDKFGYINANNDIIIDFIFDNAQDFEENLAGIEIKGKWGFIDKTGNIVIDTQYDNVCNFKDGMSFVEIKGKWGLIDKLGNSLSEFIFDDVSDFYDGLARVEIDNLYGFIDKTGSFVIQPIYYDAGNFSESLAYATTKDKYGFIDKTGRFVINQKFEWVTEPVFNNGLAQIVINGQDGYINRDGKIIVPKRK